jgi:DNA helicase TIP49 (TBP-interacting protein)
MPDAKQAVLIAGPTASGKSALAISLKECGGIRRALQYQLRSRVWVTAL